MTKTLRPAPFPASLSRCSARCPRAVGRPIRSRCRSGDHICIIGNTLAERMQYDGWLETMLHARFPKHDLVIRNLGFSGDEIATRLRSKNFGTPDEWLSGKRRPIGGYEENRLAGANTKADVIFAFFGYNESYAGAGRAARRSSSSSATGSTHTLAQKYNGKSAPRIVLFSPIAHEDLHNPGSAGRPREQRRGSSSTRRRWGKSRRRKASGSSTCSRRAVSSTRAAKTPLTINGVHLNAEGNRRIAEVIDRALFGAPPAPTRGVPDRRCGRRSSTRTFTGSTAIARPTASRPSATARS